MKKLFSTVAIATMLLGAGCAQNETVSTGKASITVKITNQSSATRAIEAPAGLSDLTPGLAVGGTHFVYVIEGGTVVHSEPLTVPTSAAGQILAGGAKNFATDASVYVLANIPGNIASPGNLGSMTDIGNAFSAISYSANHNTDYKHPAMGNFDGQAAQIGAANAAGMATVNVKISPLYARVELQGIQGGEWIHSFTVKNIWIDDYNESFSMTGAGSAFRGMGQNYQTAADIPAGWFGDQVEAGKGDWTAPANPTDTDRNPVTAGTNQVWAYHVGAGSLVRIIVELENVYRFQNDGSEDEPEISADPEEDPVEGPTFVTVTGYTQTNLTAFQRGYIYSVKPITFNKVGPINDDMVAITAEVEILNWVREELNPIAL